MHKFSRRQSFDCYPIRTYIVGKKASNKSHLDEEHSKLSACKNSLSARHKILTEILDKGNIFIWSSICGRGIRNFALTY